MIEKDTVKPKFKDFILNKTNLWIYCFSCALLLLVYFTHFKKADLRFFPSHNSFNVKFYNDSIDGGNSKVEDNFCSDSLIQMSFILQKGFVRPYVGIDFNNKNGKNIDISDYNQITVETEGHDLKNIIIYLITRNDVGTVTGDKNNEHYFSNNIVFSAHTKKYSLLLNDFHVPDWWYDVNNLSPEQNIIPDWNHFNRINIATGLPPKLGTKHKLNIRSISFVKNNTSVIILFVFIQFALMILLFIMYVLKIKSLNKSKQITINYKPVTVSKEPSEKYLDYIHEHFQDSTLNLDIVSVNTGMSQRNISDSISEQFGCNFKTYINQIRISEAQRLLKESDLNISEIAYSVGFSSPNNFNRVFKNITGQNPSEYLQSLE